MIILQAKKVLRFGPYIQTRHQAVYDLNRWTSLNCGLFGSRAQGKECSWFTFVFQCTALPSDAMKGLAKYFSVISDAFIHNADNSFEAIK